MRPGECALVGVGVGTVGGLTYASTTGNGNFEDWVGGVAVGAAGGALVGYGFCYLMSGGGRYVEAEAQTKVAHGEPTAEPENRPFDERYGLVALQTAISPSP